MQAPMLAAALVLASATADAQLASRAPQVRAPGALPLGGAPCGQYDDGTSENAIGLVTGGEIGWLHYSDCRQEFTAIETAYGSALFPGSVPNGNNSCLAIYEDPSCDMDPIDAVPVAVVPSIVVNASTDILNSIPVAVTTTTCCTFVMASADHGPGEFPAPLDEGSSGPEAWIVGSTAGPGSLDKTDLQNNALVPTPMENLYPGYFLLRTQGPECAQAPGTKQCFGDGFGTPCPCGNNNSGTGPRRGEAGCANSFTSEGCNLTATGDPSLAGDTLQFCFTGAVPSPPPLNGVGVLFQGETRLNGGNGVPFGDGLLCCGPGYKWLEFFLPDASGGGCSTVTVSTVGGALPGDTRCYQLLYSNAFSPCGTGLNFSNGYKITWLP